MSYNSKYTGAEVEALLDAANGKQDKIEDLDEIRSGAAAGSTALQSVPSEYVTENELTAKGYATTSALNDKVDKVSGKQLSTEDFTSALKAKLEGLSNYDDTTLANAISGLETRLNTLVSGDASTAIESFNEIMAFLDGIKDTQDLASIIASIEQQIAAKQDKITDLDTIRSGAAKGATALQSYTEKYTGTITGIKMNGASKGTSGVVDLGTVITAHQDISGKQDNLVSGTNIKTINGESILGSGNIEVGGGNSVIMLNDETPSVTLSINTTYIAPPHLRSLTVNGIEDFDGRYGECTIAFKSYLTGMTLTLPDEFLWANGTKPEIDGNTEYELSISVRKNMNFIPYYKAVLTPFKTV